MSTLYDVIVIGGGPAGLSAGLYAGRALLKTLIIEKIKLGGQIVITNEVENYPGSIEDATGPSLIKRMDDQAVKFGVEKTFDEIVSVDFSGDIKKLKGKKSEYEAKSIIVATGAFPKVIGCPGEAEYVGRGVSYCATCDGAFFEDLEVYVVGGGDSAIEEAIFLTKFARKVTIIHRRDELRAAKSLQEHAFKNPKMDFIWDSVVEEVKGTDGIMDTIVIKNVKTGELKELNADPDDGTFGLFVFVGYNPYTEVFKDILDMEGGYIKTDDRMRTNVKNVFCAGDCRVKTLRQVITAAADGAIAAVEAEKGLH